MDYLSRAGSELKALDHYATTVMGIDKLQWGDAIRKAVVEVSKSAIWGDEDSSQTLHPQRIPTRAYVAYHILEEAWKILLKDATQSFPWMRVPVNDGSPLCIDGRTQLEGIAREDLEILPEIVAYWIDRGINLTTLEAIESEESMSQESTSAGDPAFEEYEQQEESTSRPKNNAPSFTERLALEGRARYQLMQDQTGIADFSAAAKAAFAQRYQEWESACERLTPGFSPENFLCMWYAAARALGTVDKTLPPLSEDVAGLLAAEGYSPGRERAPVSADDSTQQAAAAPDGPRLRSEEVDHTAKDKTTAHPSQDPNEALQAAVSDAAHLHQNLPTRSGTPTGLLRPADILSPSTPSKSSKSWRHGMPTYYHPPPGPAQGEHEDPGGMSQGPRPRQPGETAGSPSGSREESEKAKLPSALDIIWYVGKIVRSTHEWEETAFFDCLTRLPTHRSEEYYDRYVKGEIWKD
ncbi:hypothetical protein F5B20DRAFT_578293 [Whalleya microplaca]|nr:hypothetical protein F5B20DRAFT_578293 [Whalleya microplaca]